MSRTLAINLSLDRGSSYDATGVDSIKLDFPLDSADFSRQGDTLVISSNDGSGAQALLNNYFTENEAHELPTLELQDGTVVSGVDFLNTYEIDTAAGPSETTSGLNNYSSDAGKLISGVDRLGTLDSNGNSTGSNSTGSNSTGSNSTGDNKDSEIYDGPSDERFVFQPTSQITSEVTINVAHSAGQSIAVLSHNKEYIKELTVDPKDGSIRVELTEAGQDALKNEGSEALALDLTVSVAGKERSVEVILNAPKDFISSEADTASGLDTPIAYEHHIMKETYKDGHLVAGGTKGSDVTVTTSGSDGVKNVTIEGTEHTTVNITTSGENNSGIIAEKGETNTLHSLDSVTIKASSTGENGNIESSVGIKNTVEGEEFDVDTLSKDYESTINSNQDVVNAVAAKDAAIKAVDAIEKELEEEESDHDYTLYDAADHASYVLAKSAFFTYNNATGERSIEAEQIEKLTAASEEALSAFTREDYFESFKTDRKVDKIRVAAEEAEEIAKTTAEKAAIREDIATSSKASSKTTISDVEKDVTIEGDSGIVSKGKYGEITTTISDVGNNVNITGTRYSGIMNDGNDTVITTTTISNVNKDVTVTGKTGISTSGQYSKTEISNVNNDVTVKGTETGTSTSNSGKTEISNVHQNVTVKGTETGTSTSGQYSKTEISNVNKDVTVTGKTGISTSNDGDTYINNVHQNVTVKGTETGISTSDKGSRTWIHDINNDVTVTGETGISTSNDGYTYISDVNNDVTVKGDKTGISTTTINDGLWLNFGTRISNVHQNVTVTGGETGISTSNGGNTYISDVNKDVTVKGGETGISTSGQNSLTWISDVNNDLTVTGDKTGISTSGQYSYSWTWIKGVNKDVTVTGGETGISTSGQHSSTDIYWVNKDVTVTGGKTGISTSNDGDTYISYVNNDVTVKGGETGISTSGQHSITRISKVNNDVTVTGNETGISTSNGGRTWIFEVYNDVTVTGKTGISTSGQHSSTEIGEINKDLTVTGGETGISTSNGGKIDIYLVDGVNVTGGETGISTSGQDSKTHISHVYNNNITVTATNNAIYSDDHAKTTISANNVTLNGAVHAENGATNTISSSHSAPIALTLRRCAIGCNDPYSIHSDETTTFDDKIDLEKGMEIPNDKSWECITLTANNIDEFMDRYGDWLAYLKENDNNLKDFGVNQAVLLNYSGQYRGPGVNTSIVNFFNDHHWSDYVTVSRITECLEDYAYNTSAITLTITANDAGGVALSAIGKDSQNIIHGHSTAETLNEDGTVTAATSDHITIVGGIQADSSCVNKITTGNGNDVITLDGKIYSADSLDINMGTGWNQLVLTAPNIDEFMDRYGVWLSKIADNNTNIADSLGISTIDIESPNKDLSFDEFLAQLGNDTFYTLIDSLHDHGVDITYHDDGNIWESHHTLDLTGYDSAIDLHLSDDVHTVNIKDGHYSHTLEMGHGDDTLSIDGTDLTGATINMGDGNDHLSLCGGIILNQTTIDGGTGYDVLELGHLSALQSSEGSLDLSSIADSVSGFEVIDISGSHGTLHIDMDSLFELHIDSANAVNYEVSDPAQGFDVSNLHADNTLVIKADSDESVSFEDTNWQTSGATVSDGGHEYTVYTNSSMSHEEEQCFILLQTGTMK